jgi:uncharacterized membrane protein (DUF373 family)
MNLGNEAVVRTMRRGETLVYVLIAALLCVGAALLLGDAVYQLATHLDDGVDVAAADMLDALFLTFIFVELLSAVGTTIQKGRLVAEPFLLVGIIASIKEILLIAGTEDQSGDEFREAMIEIGVLGGLALVLALAAFLLRLKEREPEEQEEVDA